MESNSRKMPIYRVKGALIVVLWKWFGSAAMDHAFCLSLELSCRMLASNSRKWIIEIPLEGIRIDSH